MKILLVTQEDAFYIPKLLSLLIPARKNDFVGLTVLVGEVSNRNIRKYLDFMGPLDFARYAAKYATYAICDRLFPRGIGRGRQRRFFSVRAVARHFGLPIYEPEKINAPEFLQVLEPLDLDLIVSVAAPQIFRKAILELPKQGCINIHNGLLPKYQGVLPSFHVLARGEKFTGTTVHYMVEKIDAGDVILQEQFKIKPSDTLHSLVTRTKITMGPRLLLRAIEKIEKGSVETIPVDWSQATYYSFPDAEAVRAFRARGRKFG